MPLDIQTLLLMVTFAYGMGVFLYDLLPGLVSLKPWRVAAYPFAAIVIANVLFPLGPTLGEMYVIPAIAASLVGVLVDWLVTWLRKPTAVEQAETRGRLAEATR